MHEVITLQRNAGTWWKICDITFFRAPWNVYSPYSHKPVIMEMQSYWLQFILKDNWADKGCFRYGHGLVVSIHVLDQYSKLPGWAQPSPLTLTSWSWVLLEKPPVAQLLKNFPTFYGTRRFITVFTRALHWSLSWARSIQYIPPHPIYLRSNIIPPPTSRSS
jgi:hypothetical protein